MDVPIFLAADYANQTDSGKLNVLGIFHVIFAKRFPAKHQSLFLVMRLEFESGEFDHEHDVMILFIDRDGNEILKNTGKVAVKRPEKQKRFYADVLLEIKDLPLDGPGIYDFKLLINHETRKTLSLQVVQVEDDDIEE